MKSEEGSVVVVDGGGGGGEGEGVRVGVGGPVRGEDVRNVRDEAAMVSTDEVSGEQADSADESQKELQAKSYAYHPEREPLLQTLASSSESGGKPRTLSLCSEGWLSDRVQVS